MDNFINEKPFALPPVGGISWLQGGFLPGIMHRVKCAEPQSWEPGMAVGTTVEGTIMYPWIYSPLGATQRQLNEIAIPVVKLEEFATEPVFLGITVDRPNYNEYALIAGPGSIVCCRCDQANDVPTGNVGQWVGLSADPGVVRSYTAAQVVAAAGAGKIIGRIVQGAGTVLGLNKTGSAFYCAVRIIPR